MSTSQDDCAVRILSHNLISSAPSIRLAAQHTLGPMDHVALKWLPISVLFLYQCPPTLLLSPDTPSSSSTAMLDVDTLRAALAALLHHHPHLGGRLRFASDASPLIADLDAGARFVQATCHSALQPRSQAFCVQDLPQSGAPFVPSHDDRLVDEVIANEPLFAVQHTRMACGSVVLGLQARHILCDARGFFALVRALARLYRRLRTHALPYDLRPRAPCDDVEPLQDQSYSVDASSLTPDFEPSMYRLRKTEQTFEAMQHTPTAEPQSIPASPSPVLSRVVSLSKQQVARIKSRAQGRDGEWATTFEALCAHLWQRIYLARLAVERAAQRSTVSPPSTTFMSPADWSGAARLDLASSYLPNAIFITAFRVPEHMLREADVAALTQYIHCQCRKLTVSEARETLAWIQQQPDKSCIEMEPPFEKGMFIISAWHKLPCYDEVHFDEVEGAEDQERHPLRPCLVAPPVTPISLVDGLIYTLPPPPHTDLAMHLSIALDEQVWRHLDRDPAFLSLDDANAS